MVCPRILLSRILAFALHFSWSAAVSAAGATTADVVVYTATAGGVTASVAAARPGAKVVLIEPGQHVGGMLSGGLGHSDVFGQEVAEGWLNVRRLLWVTRIPLQTLTDAEWRRGPFGWAWRTCGNGGLFSFTGWYHQKSLGSFRALATRTTDAVILTFSDRKPFVITPDDPGGFVESVKTIVAR